MENKKYILAISCSDVMGIIAAISGHFVKYNAFIIESSQYSDPRSNNFFIRIVFESPTTASTSIADNFHVVADKFQMEWSLQDVHYKPKVLLMTSKASHCLVDILHKVRCGSLDIEIPAIVSNHTDLEHIAKWYEVPFHHMPITKENKKEQEENLTKLIEDLGIEHIVLARYMQILSPEFCNKYMGRIINIHHSFLPSFKGSRPYHQAFDKGVKIIGATSHYITNDLEEGPIIEQEIIHVTHNHTPEKLIELGCDIEASVLSKTVKLQSEKRIFINGSKTVVFKR